MAQGRSDAYGECPFMDTLCAFPIETNPVAVLAYYLLREYKKRKFLHV
jgi:hypothetical protein